MFHLFPIGIFPHFTGRLCHFWYIIQRRRRPVGKPVRQKSPLGRLIFLVLSLLFSSFFLRLKNYIFGTASSSPCSQDSGFFLIILSFCAKKQKRTNFHYFFKFSLVAIE